MSDLKLNRPCVYHHKMVSIESGKFVHGTVDWDVKLMAISGRYAMVRRKGCIPLVCEVKDLSPVQRGNVIPDSGTEPVPI